MALITGVFNTGKNPPELNLRSFAGTILRLFPNGSAPMFALTSQSGKSRAVSTTHGYFSKTMSFVKGTMGAAVADGVATAFNVGSTVGMTPNMVLYFPATRENVRVLTIVDAANIMVKRGYG